MHRFSEGLQNTLAKTGPRMIRQRLESQYGQWPRRCLLQIPQAAPVRDLLMVLHGCGGTASWMAVETALEIHAEVTGLALAFPEATRADMTRPAHFMNNAPCWDDGANRPQPKPANNADDAAWICQLSRDLVKQFGLSRPPYLAGFSNGAGMIAATIEHGAAPFSGAAYVCGYPRRDPVAAVMPVPSLFLMGEVDPLVPWGGGDVVLPWHPDFIAVPDISTRILRWAHAMGAKSSAEAPSSAGPWRSWRYGDIETSAGVEVRLIQGLGHHWPGGRGQWTDPRSGARRDDIDAGAIILDYFGLGAGEG